MVSPTTCFIIPMTHAPEAAPYKSSSFSGAGFRRQFFVPYASGVKISGGEDKRV